MLREERVTVQGPVKKQQQTECHTGGGGGVGGASDGALVVSLAWRGIRWARWGVGGAWGLDVGAAEHIEELIVHHLWPDNTPTQLHPHLTDKDMPGNLWAFFGTILHLHHSRTHTLPQTWYPPTP